jgi:hypothetical protein
MRHDVNPTTRKSIREIVDGQQRLKTILSYLEDGFKISRIHNEEFAAKYFSQLPEKTQKEFLQYQISVDILLGAQDSQVLDIFARLNSYTVRLNKQELLNAKYFGVFKNTVYSLGYEYLNFWISNGILSNKEVARMGEAEFSSELLILALDGVQDRKRIEIYYKRYDDDFPAKHKVVKIFKKTIDTISEIMGDAIPASNFSSKPLFYSLFGVIKELISENRLCKADYPKVLIALQDIDIIINSEPEELTPKNYKFYDAVTKHVTDLSRRKIRHKFIKNYIIKQIKAQ